MYSHAVPSIYTRLEDHCAIIRTWNSADLTGPSLRCVDKIAWLATLSIYQHINTLVHNIGASVFLSVYVAGFSLLLLCKGQWRQTERYNKEYI